MSQAKGDEQVQEVEVERLPLPEEASQEPSSPSDPVETVRRVHSALGPIVAGLVVDALDAATFNPVLGLLLGLAVGFYLARQLGLKGKAAWKMAGIVGVYCGAPGTFALPLGTLAGAYVRLRQVLSGKA